MAYSHNGVLLGSKVNKVLIPVAMWVGLETSRSVKEVTEDHIWNDAIHMEFPEMANL